MLVFPNILIEIMSAHENIRSCQQTECLSFLLSVIVTSFKCKQNYMENMSENFVNLATFAALKYII